MGRLEYGLAPPAVKARRAQGRARLAHTRAVAVGNVNQNVVPVPGALATPI
jgi:hypothetical protein